jgi:hypothetical protein
MSAQMAASASASLPFINLASLILIFFSSIFNPSTNFH